MSFSTRQTSRRRHSRLVVESLEPRRLLPVDFDYAMAQRFGLDLNHNGLIDLPNTSPIGFG